MTIVWPPQILLYYSTEGNGDAHLSPTAAERFPPPIEYDHVECFFRLRSVTVPSLLQLGNLPTHHLFSCLVLRITGPASARDRSNSGPHRVRGQRSSFGVALHRCHASVDQGHAQDLPGERRVHARGRHVSQVKFTYRVHAKVGRCCTFLSCIPTLPQNSIAATPFFICRWGRFGVNRFPCSFFFSC